MGIINPIINSVLSGVVNPAVVQIAANLNPSRTDLDNYIIELASIGNTDVETIDLTVGEYANVFRTTASNDAMIILQDNNKLVLVNEILGNTTIENGSFGDSGIDWSAVGESTVNTGVGRIYSTGATSYIAQSSAMEIGLFYKCIYKVIGTPTGTAQLGNLADYGRINSSHADSNNLRRFVTLDSTLLFKRLTACDASVDDVELNQVVNNRYTSIGDSITSPPSYVTKLKEEKVYFNINWAVGGDTILDPLGFLTQVANSAGDNADLIIICIGTNDINSSDMSVLQGILESGISTLKTTNPNATIYVMNILPRWTDTGGATPEDKGNIRTMISTSCLSQSVTCWDTFTDPWIDAADTLDGLHPTDAGHEKIKDRIVALLPVI